MCGCRDCNTVVTCMTIANEKNDESSISYNEYLCVQIVWNMLYLLSC